MNEGINITAEVDGNIVKWHVDSSLSADLAGEVLDCAVGAVLKYMEEVKQ